MEDEPLYESDRFAIECDGEQWDDVHVYLRGPAIPTGLVIGHFDYQPAPTVAVDPDERWAVMVGAGLIVYRLSPPWLPYDRLARVPSGPGQSTHGWGLQEVSGNEQWWEYGRSTSKVLDLSSVHHVEGERFDASWGREVDSGPTSWSILAESRIVRAANWLPDLQ
jgi:hypothetical protein